MNKYKPETLKIAMGTIFHNKPKELDRMLHSFSHLGVDHWFLIGGGFKDSPDDPHENGETVTVLENFRAEQDEYGSQGIEIGWSVMLGATEFQKRNRYLDYARQYGCNALMVIDSDEYAYENKEWEFEKNWEKFRRFYYSFLERYPEHNVYSVRIIVNEFLGFDYYPHCLAYPEKVAYVQASHYKFGNIETDDVNDPLFTHQASWGTMEGITLKHDHTLRTEEDMKARRGYQDFLVKYEQLLDRPDLTGGDPLMARRMALREVVPFNDNCMCMLCFKMKGIPVEQVMDPRPRDKRQKNPYVTGVPL